MKKNVIIATALLGLFFISCDKDEDELKDATVELKSEINDFVWKGLNQYYLWQEEVPNLADSKIDNESDYINLLNGFDEPEDFFYNIAYRHANIVDGENAVDRFSQIVNDYVELENSFQGISKTSGVDFQLVSLQNSDDVFGYVRYIIPNTDASTKDIKRGDFFLEVDGQQLNIENYEELLFSDKNSYTLGMAEIENGVIDLNNKSVSLNLAEIVENPVLISKTIPVDGKNVGYVMYNSFTANFEQELNAAFGELKAAGITDMVLDLRYNGGGRVRTAKYLASMLTGQFNGQLISKERWNSKIQEFFESENPEALINNFTNEIRNTDADGNVVLQEPINSLNLDKLYVLVSDRTASASELIINGLNPYINVVLIGTRTVGKNVGSVTLYDSDGFNRTGANPNHTYAMQPIVLEIVNKLGENNINGFMPDIQYAEDIQDLGALGDINEPMLNKALNDITGNSVARETVTKSKILTEKLINSKSFSPLYQEMYIDRNLDFLKN